MCGEFSALTSEQNLCLYSCLCRCMCLQIPVWIHMSPDSDQGEVRKEEFYFENKNHLYEYLLKC